MASGRVRTSTSTFGSDTLCCDQPSSAPNQLADPLRTSSGIRYTNLRRTNCALRQGKLAYPLDGFNLFIGDERSIVLRAYPALSARSKTSALYVPVVKLGRRRSFRGESDRLKALAMRVTRLHFQRSSGDCVRVDCLYRVIGMRIGAPVATEGNDLCPWQSGGHVWQDSGGV